MKAIAIEDGRGGEVGDVVSQSDLALEEEAEQGHNAASYK